MMGWIYFIQVGEEGPVKIGWAMDPKKRLAQFQTANPHVLHLRGTIPGSQQDEKNTHGFFAEHRIHGEWFQPCQCIFNFLCRQEVPDPSLGWTEPRDMSLNLHNPLEVPAFPEALLAPIGWGAGVRTPWSAGDEDFPHEEIERFLADLKTPDGRKRLARR